MIKKVWTNYITFKHINTVESLFVMPLLALVFEVRWSLGYLYANNNNSNKWYYVK